MATVDAVRTILFKFAADAGEILQASDEVAIGMGNVEQAGSKMGGVLAAAGKQAAIGAATMAAEWAVAGIDMATTAGQISANFDDTFGPATAQLTDEVEELAGHMGLAEHEAENLLAAAGALTKSMGATDQQAAEMAESMFILAGDMRAGNKEAGSSAEAMEAITKAAAGSTKALRAWDVHLTSSEISARALADTGKETAAELTAYEKELATVALIQEKTAGSTGKLEEAIASGNTEFAQAEADIKDMQVEVGNALMPIKKLALEGVLVLAEVLTSLQPAIEAVGDLLSALLIIIKPLLSLVSLLAQVLGGALGVALKLVMKLLEPFLKLLERVSGAIGKLVSKMKGLKGIGGLKMPSFHSGGRVPGAEGSLQPIMAQGGETVGRGGGGAGGPGTVVNITVEAGVSAPQDIARTISDMLVEYTAVQGPIDLKVNQN